MGKGKAKKLRKLHIEDQIWRWYVNKEKDTVIIFSPEKKRSEVLRKYWAQESDEYNLWYYETAITPGQVRDYILKNLKERKEKR